MVECEFCRIVDRLLPAEVVYETASTLAFFPLEPATRGHTMVIPKRHTPNFLDIARADVTPVANAVVVVGRALRAVLQPDGMNLISSAGEAASQSVMHLHFHLVPRWQDDAVGEIWPPKRPTSERVLEETADAIREFCATEHLDQRNPE